MNRIFQLFEYLRINLLKVNSNLQNKGKGDAPNSKF